MVEKSTYYMKGFLCFRRWIWGYLTSIYEDMQGEWNQTDIFAWNLGKYKTIPFIGAS